MYVLLQAEADFALGIWLFNTISMGKASYLELIEESEPLVKDSFNGNNLVILIAWLEQDIWLLITFTPIHTRRGVDGPPHLLP